MMNDDEKLVYHLRHYPFSDIGDGQFIIQAANTIERLTTEVRNAYIAGWSGGNSFGNSVDPAAAFKDWKATVSSRRDIGQEIVSGLKEHRAVDGREQLYTCAICREPHHTLDCGQFPDADRRADSRRDQLQGSESANRRDIWLYNQGYMAGHNDTVEGCYTDVQPVDEDSYHDDVVADLLAENPEFAAESGQEETK